MAKLTLDLPVKARNALNALARDEYRDPRTQAALIIERELKRRGLLPRTEKGSAPASKEQGEKQPSSN